MINNKCVIVFLENFKEILNILLKIFLENFKENLKIFKKNLIEILEYINIYQKKTDIYICIMDNNIQSYSVSLYHTSISRLNFIWGACTRYSTECSIIFCETQFYLGGLSPQALMTRRPCIYTINYYTTLYNTSTNLVHKFIILCTNLDNY